MSAKKRASAQKQTSAKKSSTAKKQTFAKKSSTAKKSTTAKKQTTNNVQVEKVVLEIDVNKENKISEDIGKLIKQGIELINTENDNNLASLNFEYEKWYTKSLVVVQQIIPERLTDFKNLYKCDKRKNLQLTTYRIYDYLQGIMCTYGGGFDSLSRFRRLFSNQLSILTTALDNLDSILRDIKGVLKAEMHDSELEAAKKLRKNNYIRSAGVLCGVILEGHFKSIAMRRKIKITQRNPTISGYNDDLRNAGVYDIPQWRKISYLADIRNLCGHKKEREPTDEDVDELIIGTEKVIKEVF